jgi:hypothetical protein
MMYYRAQINDYEAVRAAVDAANSWPDAGTLTSFEPAANAPRDSRGRILLACPDWLAELAGDFLAGLEKIAESEYLPVPPPGE